MRRTIETIQLDSEHTLSIELFYSKGDVTLATMMGYSNGPEPRGYWLSARREAHRNGFVSFCLGDGKKLFLKETKRFNAKEFEALRPTEEQLAKVKSAYVQR